MEFSVRVDEKVKRCRLFIGTLNTEFRMRAKPSPQNSNTVLKCLSLGCLLIVNSFLLSKGDVRFAEVPG